MGGFWGMDGTFEHGGAYSRLAEDIMHLSRLLFQRNAHALERLRRTEENFDSVRAAKPDIPDFPPEIKRQAEIEVKYQGYIDRQQAEVKKFRRMEDTPLPEGTDYMAMAGLRIEAREKLQRRQPRSLGQASRIPGVSPGDVTVLMIWLKSREGKV